MLKKVGIRRLKSCLNDVTINLILCLINLFIILLFITFSKIRSKIRSTNFIRLANPKNPSNRILKWTLTKSVKFRLYCVFELLLVLLKYWGQIYYLFSLLLLLLVRPLYTYFFIHNYSYRFKFPRISSSLPS
jgi:hypothetical protein